MLHSGEHTVSNSLRRNIGEHSISGILREREEIEHDHAVASSSRGLAGSAVYMRDRPEVDMDAARMHLINVSLLLCFDSMSLGFSVIYYKWNVQF